MVSYFERVDRLARSLKQFPQCIAISTLEAFDVFCAFVLFSKFIGRSLTNFEKTKGFLIRIEIMA